MVLGLRTRTLKSISVQIDYLINVLEIHPWTSSDARISAQSVLLQCENGGESCGIFVSSVGDGKIDFSKAFRLTVTLLKEGSKKGASRDGFQNNFLEFHLYEVRKEKKGKLLGSASINLADYATITDNVALNTPVYLKKPSKHSAQPILHVNIQTLDKDNSSSSPENSLSKEMSAAGSVSEFIDGGHDDEAEIASFTDDDDDGSSLHSSRTISTLETTMPSPTDGHQGRVELGSDSADRNRLAEAIIHLNGSSSRTVSSSDILSGTELLGRDPNFSSEQPVESERVADDSTGIQKTMTQGDNGGITNSLIGKTSEDDVLSVLNANFSDSTTNQEVDRRQIKADEEKCMSGALNSASFGDKEKQEQQECVEKETVSEKTKNHIDNQIARKIPVDAVRKLEKSSDTVASSRNTLGIHGGTLRNDKLKHLKSLQLTFDSSKSGGIYAIDLINNHKKKDVLENAPKISVTSDSDKTGRHQAKDEKGNDLSETNISSMTTVNDEKSNYISKHSDSKTGLESEVEMLREELREAAAVEISLYSVVAEHGSSANKVHAPARRLYRFYCHILRSKSSSSLASAARTIVSGLMLVSKSCGHDVPRLTFWLSNAILLRGMIKKAVEKSEISPARRKNSNAEENLDDWDEPQTLITAMEKVEAWIFTRIVESVWWQSLTPYMQSAASKGSSSRKTSGKRYVIGDQDQGKFSIDLWKKAFTDAGERLCPLRAGGHECGCLHIITRLVIEQLVGRLDVAMFNAILRESADEMPTDPFSDPISDSKVLPIPAGKSSFGSGAQLKNAVGNWSRCLTDLYGIDDSDSLGDRNELNENHEAAPFKVFNLLNALSDLMMLPFEMLAERSTRREVCPNLGVPLIRRVLTNFVPDEFCPSPVPEALLDALDSEDYVDIEGDEKSVASFPCMASPTIYSPPSASSLREVGSVTWPSSSSPMLRKSYTSDDELDELDSPLNALIIEKTRSSPTSTGSNLLPKDKGGRRVVRYELLREIWGDNH